MYCTCIPNYTTTDVSLNWHGVYRLGSQGPNVRKIQTMLNQVYHGWGPQLRVDGVYGHSTQHVVKRFQRDFGRTQDGIVGPNTWTALAYQAGKKRGAHRNM